MTPRSYLFVRGNRPERFAKALSSGADMVLIDLEDAVPPHQKIPAREALSRWLTAERQVGVRINAAGTSWHADDLSVCRHPGVAAVMIAKAERAEDLEAAGLTVPLLPLIESAAGFDQLRAIAAVPTVQRLAFGAIDFQLDMRMDGTFDELIHFRSALALASRVASLLPPIDSPSVELDNTLEVESEARAARRLGFGAKLCIHLRQVDAVNQSFSPTSAELEWARRVLAIAELNRGAAASMDGTMIDRPVILRAEAILSARR